MRHVFFLLSVFYITGCVAPIKYTPACQSYQKLVEESWTFDKANQIYRIKGPSPAKSIAQIFEKKECIYGATKPQVKRLFGSPSSIERGQWLYYMGYGCDQEPRKNCEYMVLSFDENEHLSKLNLRAMSIEE